MMQMKPSQLLTLLTHAIPARINVSVSGGPGIGKTEIIAQAAKLLDADHVVSTPGVEDPTNASGLPWIGKDKERAVFLPFGQTAKVLDATKLTVWDLEDFGQAPALVQASYMPWLSARELNGHKLPDCVSIVATTNRRTDRAGVGGYLEPVKSRFGVMVELVPDLDEWCNWYVTQPFMVPEVLAFQRALRGEKIPNAAPDGIGYLYQFVPTADMTNCPLPRTWTHASKILKLGMPADVEAAALAGAVGEGAATAFLGFRTMYRSLPALAGIIMNPDGAEIPTNLSALYSVTSGLASMANDQNFSRIARYTQRLADVGRGDFASLLVSDATRRNPMLQQTPDFAVLMAGEIGQLVTGRA